MRRHSACLVPRFFTGERVGQRGFLKVLVTGIVTNRKQKIPSQITGKIMFITYCFSNFHAKLFFYRLCTSTLVNSFHLIVIVLMTQQFTIFLSYFLLYHNQFSLRSATILLFSAGAGFSTLAPVILKKLGVNC